MESKMVMTKKEVEEDRISNFPDAIIQHILSFLPSTKQAIRTTVLSKRWRNQWTQVPVLIFDFDGKLRKKFLKFIDKALLLHDCSKIHKFQLRCLSWCLDEKDPRFAEKIAFATSKYFQAIENVLSVSLLLESFELMACCEFGHLVIASNSLKKFVLGEYCYSEFDIEISCPRLEELKLLGYLNVKTAKLLNLPSSLRATIDFKHFGENKPCKSLVIETLQLFQQFKELKLGSWFLENMSSIKVGDRFSLVLNVKCLAVDSPRLVKHHPGIACLLHISPVLEKLVINVPLGGKANHKNIGKNYWDSNADVFDCLVSHLKTIEITGFPERAGRRESMLHLVKYLLKNARVLEKMVVILKKDHVGTSPSDIYQELSSLPRCSQKAIIEVVCF